MRPAVPLLLFDIDGVLVEPRGYSAAVEASIRHLIQPLGLPESYQANRELYARFEAHRITSEWDMLPILLAALFDRLLQADPELPIPISLEGLPSLRPVRFPSQPDYGSYIQRLAPRLKPGEYPAETTLLSSDLFPHFSPHPLWSRLLSSSRSVAASPTTRLFQQYSLGSTAFEEVYGLPAEIQTSSYLQEYDRPLLAPAWRDRLLSAREAGHLHMAAYTQRPSRPPCEQNKTSGGYSPEAEMALSLAGLSSIPLIGYGRVRALAEDLNLETEKLLKPSPVHALAAIFAAWSAQELTSLQAAGSLLSARELVSFPGLQEAGPVHIHVFEDSRGGIEAVQQAAVILKQAGIDLQLSAWGISANAEKIKALESLGTPVYPDVNQALEAALPHLQP